MYMYIENARTFCTDLLHDVLLKFKMNIIKVKLVNTEMFRDITNVKCTSYANETTATLYSTSTRTIFNALLQQQPQSVLNRNNKTDTIFYADKPLDTMQRRLLTMIYTDSLGFYT